MWFALFVAFAAGLTLWPRRPRPRKGLSSARSREPAALLPTNRYPSINSSACIGCSACLSACPEGGVLQLVEGRAVLADASACVGHGKCAVVCPTGALTLHLGSIERPLLLPETLGRQSSRPGIYVAGDVSGAGLIGQAMQQGAQAAREAVRDLSAAPGAAADAIDVLVVGAGPAGLAAALTLRALGCSFRVIERGTLGGTVANYPRQKVVMVEPLPLLKLRAGHGTRSLSKEVLLQHLHDACDAADLAVEEGCELTTIDGSDGAFVARTGSGAIAARRVILATGMQGAPRKLGVPGEGLDVVTYRLSDPAQYAGARVLVVGGGNSAMEAAIALAGVAKTEVTLIHRSPLRGRAETQQALAQLVAQRRVRRREGVELARVDPGRVELRRGEGPSAACHMDYVIIQAGGTLPEAFLRRLQLLLRAHQGDAVPAPPALAAAGAWVVLARRLGLVLNALALGCAAAACLCLATLLAHAATYYRTPEALRGGSPWDAQLRPAGDVGLALGVAACALMLGNTLYVLRRRLSVLSASGSVASWLTTHVILGTVAPLCVAFHAGFCLRNQFGWTVLAALATVVLTGYFGRFMAGLARAALGMQAPPTRLLHQLALLYQRMLEQRAHEGALLRGFPAPPNASTSLWAATADLLRPSRQRSEDNAWRRYHGMHRAYLRGRWCLAARRAVARVLGLWRPLHVLSACGMLFIVVGHIAFMLYLGFARLF